MRTFPFMSLLSVSLFLEMLVKFAGLKSLWVVFFHEIGRGAGSSRACSTVLHAESALPSITSSTAISCPIAEDPKGHFWSHLEPETCFLGTSSVLLGTSSVTVIPKAPSCCCAGRADSSPLHHPARVFEAPWAVPRLLGLFTLFLPPD